MINILWLFLILAVGVGALWGAYKFLGKAGLFAYGVLTIILSYILADYSIGLGEIYIVASFIPWVLLLSTLIITGFKYGKKTSIAFAISTFLAYLTLVIIMILIFATRPIGLVLEEILYYFVPTLICAIVEFIVAILFIKLFNKTKLPTIWKASIILAILVIIDVVIFAVSTGLIIEFNISEIVDFGVANLWQKAIVVALMIPVFYAFEKTTVTSCIKDEEPKQTISVEAAVVEEVPAKKVAVKAPAKAEKKTTVKKVASKKAEPAKKPTTKKATKKPTTKK